VFTSKLFVVINLVTTLPIQVGTSAWATTTRYDSDSDMSADRADWSKHPLVSMVLEFLLAAVLGNAILNCGLAE